eukprot:gnl/TRDRNA2_/TRDRNA2_152401_c1_seq1.p1 gnl/TRDRNA2_/TRDRNA2_152401_c1~~gnl/TRDRNA2_/TRDRNA2_152401_c1_seq1.p1  ORF type:complete len:138 (-),score=26.79 gnl/TRDRNA2_/TRDRNA2_152401_c1_seq1:28-441(-)
MWPYAEFFEGRFGITDPIDMRKFPSSVNKVFADHNYRHNNVRLVDIGHIQGCDSVWVGDLDNHTKKLIKLTYKKDFQLLCKHFGYCDNDEHVCIQQVPHMCPEKLFQWTCRSDGRDCVYARRDETLPEGRVVKELPP